MSKFLEDNLYWVGGDVHFLFDGEHGLDDGMQNYAIVNINDMNNDMIRPCIIELDEPVDLPVVEDDWMLQNYPQFYKQAKTRERKAMLAYFRGNFRRAMMV